MSKPNYRIVQNNDRYRIQIEVPWISSLVFRDPNYKYWAETNGNGERYFHSLTCQPQYHYSPKFHWYYDAKMQIEAWLQNHEHKPCPKYYYPPQTEPTK
jgi:hypothetical protein